MPTFKNYDLQKDGVTQSMLRTFDECRKRLHFQLDGWETKAPPRAAPRFGSLMHHALMVLYCAVRESKYPMRDKALGLTRDVMVGIFKRVGTLVGEPVGSRGMPGPEVQEECRDLGKALAEAVS